MVDFEKVAMVVLRRLSGARSSGATLVHDHWGDNLYIERSIACADIDPAARAANSSATANPGMKPGARGCCSKAARRSPIATTGSISQRLAASTWTLHTAWWRFARDAWRRRASASRRRPGCRRRVWSQGPALSGRYADPQPRSALHLDHPVRWIEDRKRAVRWTPAHCRDHHYKLTAYADRHGRVLRHLHLLVAQAAADVGLWPQGPYQEANMAARTLPGPYTIANYRALNLYGRATNKVPPWP